jgi:RHS repeat-associated protein
LFTGREYANLFGFYEYRARAYHPTLGRFMSEDPKLFVRRAGLGAPPADWTFGAHPDEAEFNLFRYCGNDPVDFTDPMGLYAEGSGWTAQQWEKFNQAQQTAALQLEKAVNRIVLAREAGKDSKEFKSLSNDFQKVFHKEATRENLSKVSQVARKMITALRDDGSKGYFANGKPGSGFRDSSVLGLGVVGGKNIWINVDHSRFGEPSTLAHAAGHESGHNAGLAGKTGVDVYEWRRADYERLTPEQRLDNADSYMEFLTSH